MQPSLSLTRDERLWFMQALNAVAFRNGEPRDVWLELLRQFGELLDVSKPSYQFQAGVPAIAQKVNGITDRRARLYFLRIVHDVHLAELEGIFWLAAKTNSRRTFEPLYTELVDAVQLD